MNAIETINVNDKVVKIFNDPDPESPTEHDTLGTMVAWHRRYQLGHKHNYKTLQEFRCAVKDIAVMLPLYLLDHSGLSISTVDFNDRWDSGQIGWIYITKEKARAEYGMKRITQKWREKLAGYLKAEVTEYDQYLRGDVYGWEVADKDGRPVDSAWGMYGYEYAKSEAISAAVPTV